MAVPPTLARLQESPGLFYQQDKLSDSTAGDFNSVGLGGGLEICIIIKQFR